MMEVLTVQSYTSIIVLNSQISPLHVEEIMIIEAIRIFTLTCRELHAQNQLRGLYFITLHYFVGEKIVLINLLNKLYSRIFFVVKRYENCLGPLLFGGACVAIVACSSPCHKAIAAVVVFAPRKGSQTTNCIPPEQAFSQTLPPSL